MTARTATLDVRWDASWRDAENWDAAWVVLKGQRSEGPLIPLRVRDAPKVAANRSPDGAGAAFDIPDDRVGFFAYRAGRGEGTNHWWVQVAWTAADGVDAEAVEGVAAYGVEMLRVPTGEFELGTTRSLTARRNANERDWLRGTSPAPLSALFQVDPDGEDRYGGPYPVTSEEPIPIGTEAGALYYLDARFLSDSFSSGDQRGTLSAAVPKGYQGFYQMKYEVTEQQYVDFLNGLSDEQARTLTDEDDIYRWGNQRVLADTDTIGIVLTKHDLIIDPEGQ